ncbi:hypothetical protein PR048_011172 [Dryococelus australis]|uniref:Uncharacterized protein n=1 Tax=Dryococelus australis TaxID=614101 RepID=A0ABQ9HLJ9_9NEOP|nr:hypothetical protein PR048_011172 [Dryococelus australis]
MKSYNIIFNMNLLTFPVSLFSKEEVQAAYVLDCVFLLHSVLMHRNESFSAICSKHYGSKVMTVFDRFPTDAANKTLRNELTHDIYTDKIYRKLRKTKVTLFFAQKLVLKIQFYFSAGNRRF